MIDITMTAIDLRPEILEETLISLVKNLVYNKPLRLIIDNAIGSYTPFKHYNLYEVANTYFDNTHLTYRMIEDSKQAEAIRWMWSRSDSDFVLHWEDDWVLIKKLDLNLVKDLFKIFPGTGMIYFDRYQKSVLDYPGYKGVFTKVFNSFYYREEGKSLGGPPALLRKDYKESVLTIMKDTECLDITSRTKKAQELLKKWDIGVYTGESGRGNLVKDIGKAWRDSKGLKMVKDTPRGVTWIPK